MNLIKKGKNLIQITPEKIDYNYFYENLIYYLGSFLLY